VQVNILLVTRPGFSCRFTSSLSASSSSRPSGSIWGGVFAQSLRRNDRLHRRDRLGDCDAALARPDDLLHIRSPHPIRTTAWTSMRVPRQPCNRSGLGNSISSGKGPPRTSLGSALPVLQIAQHPYVALAGSLVLPEEIHGRAALISLTYRCRRGFPLPHSRLTSEKHPGADREERIENSKGQQQMREHPGYCKGYEHNRNENRSANDR